MHNIIKRFRETGEISVRKGQGRRPLLDARGLRTLRRHCITHRHDSVIDITKWAQEYFQKPLSVNTIRHAICRCQLKLYHAKSKPNVKVTWHAAKYGDLYSEFMLCIYPSKCTHTAVNTYTNHEHTPGAVGSHICCGARGAVGGSVPCSRAPRHGTEGGESTVLPPQIIPASSRLELATFRLRVRLSNY